jgi:hypothetical protein
MKMADITMCSNESCPFRARCYKASAKVNPLWQSWMRFDNDKDSCFEEVK